MANICADWLHVARGDSERGRMRERERKRSILGQTRPLFLNPFAGNEHTQLQLENCTFYGCHKQRRLCATTLTFTFRSRHRDVGDVVVLCKIRNASFFLDIFCFLPLVIVFGASQKPNSNPKPFSQLLCAVGV